MQQKDYYQTLGVGSRAGPQEIKEAYRKLAFQHHPDRNQGDPVEAAKMKEINEAYAVISDPQKREQYDALRQTYGSSAYTHFRQSYSEQDIFRGSDVHEIFEEISRAFGFRSFEEIFRDFYGPGYQSFEFRRPGASVRGFVFRSSQRKTADEPVKFPHGGNLGRLIRYGLRKTWGVEWSEKGKDRYDVIRIDPRLALTGGKIRYLCQRMSRELIVTIPPGIRDGQQIRLRGMGDRGKGGGEAGDLYVKVKIRKPLKQKIRDLMRKLHSLSEAAEADGL